MPVLEGRNVSGQSTFVLFIGGHHFSCYKPRVTAAWGRRGGIQDNHWRIMIILL